MELSNGKLNIFNSEEETEAQGCQLSQNSFETFF